MTRAEFCAFARAHDNFVILTHRRPDGDTVAFIGKPGFQLSHILLFAGQTVGDVGSPVHSLCLLLIAVQCFG